MERKAYVIAEHCTGKALAATAWRRWATYSPWMPKSAAGLPVAGKGVHPKGTSAGEGRVQQTGSAGREERAWMARDGTRLFLRAKLVGYRMGNTREGDREDVGDVFLSLNSNIGSHREI